MIKNGQNCALFALLKGNVISFGKGLCPLTPDQGRCPWTPLGQRRRQMGRAGDFPFRKFPIPWAAAWASQLPVFRMHTLMERSYSTRTTMIRTNFPRFKASDFITNLR